jgi:hypothetical protein
MQPERKEVGTAEEEDDDEDNRSEQASRFPIIHKIPCVCCFEKDGMHKKTHHNYVMAVQLICFSHY